MAGQFDSGVVLAASIVVARPTVEEAFKAEVEAYGPDRARKRLEDRLAEEELVRNLTVDELFDRWFKAMDLDRIAGDLTGETVRRYELNYDSNIKPHLGYRDCGRIDPDDIQDGVDSWVREGLAPSIKTTVDTYGKMADGLTEDVAGRINALIDFSAPTACGGR